MPWKLLAGPSGYIFTWLIAYSVPGRLEEFSFATRPVVGGRASMSHRSIGWTANIAMWSGFSFAALIAFALGALPSVPGFFVQVGVISVVMRISGWPPYCAGRDALRCGLCPSQNFTYETDSSACDFQPTPYGAVGGGGVACGGSFESWLVPYIARTRSCSWRGAYSMCGQEMERQYLDGLERDRHCQRRALPSACRRSRSEAERDAPALDHNLSSAARGGICRALAAKMPAS